MRCEQCGKELPEDAKFCLECGAPVPQDVEKGQALCDPDGPEEPEAATARLASSAAPTVVPGETTELETDDGRDEAIASLGPTHEELAARDGETQETARPLEGLEDTGMWDSTGPVGRAPRPTVDSDSHSKRLGLITAVVVFVAALGLLVGFITWRMELWGGVTVPDVVGEPVADATTALEDAGFSVQTEDVVSDDAMGKVISQDPTGSRRVDAGTPVRISVGVERTVPDVEGMALDEARQALADKSIDRLRLEYQNSNEDEGTVISVSPAAGSVVAKDDLVTLVIAQPYTVPDVVGLSQEDAEEAVERAGLTPESSYVASDKEAGTVVSSDPSGGASLKEGEKVKLYVSSPYPASLYSAVDYLETRPADLSTYLREQGYCILYGASKNNVATMTWEGAEADPVVVLGPNPFASYSGFQFWATDALASGAEVQGVRLELDQTSAPDGVTLKVDQATISDLMNACGLKASEGTTTTATPSTLAISTTALNFVCKAGTQGDLSWAVCVWKDARGNISAAVCAAPTAVLEKNLEADGLKLSDYDNNLAALAADQLCLKG